MESRSSCQDVISEYTVEVPKDNIVEYCRKSYMKDSLKTAFIDLETGEKWTYQKFDLKRIEVSEVLRKLGIRRHDRVFVLMEDCLDYAAVFMGILSLGACAVLVNQKSTSQELTHFLEISSCLIIISTPLYSSTLKQVLNKHPYNIKHVLEMKKDGLKCMFPHDCLSLCNRYTTKFNPSKIPWIDGEVDSSSLPAFILFTSGTTGMSKGAIMSHKSYVSAMCQYRHPNFVSFEDTQHTIIYQPLAHGYGVFRLLYCLCTSTTALLIKQFKLQKYLSAIQTYKLTSLHLVPPIAVMMVNSDLVKQYDLSTVKYAFSSAAPMGVSLEDRLKQLLKNAKIIQAFALTEVAGVATQLPINTSSPPPKGSVGIVYPNTIVRVVKPGTKETLGVGEEGELWIKGEQNFMGYINNEQVTRETLDDQGFVHTGDCGYYDHNGFFFITDRIKEMIKYNGMQVAPAELESLLLSHPSIADAAVIGLPSEIHGQVPHAWVVLRQGTECCESEVAEWIKARVSPCKRLRGGVRFVTCIPKSANGKILRGTIRKMTTQAKL